MAVNKNTTRYHWPVVFISLAKQNVVDDTDDYGTSHIFLTHDFRAEFAPRTVYLYVVLESNREYTN